MVESFSIDEVFLDMTGTSLIYPDPIATAHEIKDKIHAELGFTVNVGISTNKLLAKMASDFEKPDKVHTLFPEEIPVKMWPLPIRDLLFLGKASEKKAAGFRNPYHRRACQGKGIRHPGFAWGKRQDISFTSMPEESTIPRCLPRQKRARASAWRKTFNDDIVSVEQVLPILLEQCDIVATRMRRKGKKCSCISVTFRTLDFKNRSHQTSLSSATDVTDEIYENARRLFLEFWKGQPLRLIGVALTGLTDESFEQMSLFEDTKKKERRQKLDAALDAIRMKFGNDKITRASIMNSNTGMGRKAKAQMENETQKRNKTDKKD